MNYIFTELKRYIKLIPYTIFSGIFIGGIFLLIGIFSPNAMYKDKLTNINISVVSYEKDFMNDFIKDFISNMDSTKDFITLELVDEKTAEERLKNNETYAIVKIPENTFINIINGKNTPAKIILNKNIKGIEAKVFKELTQVFNKMLSISQASVYAGADICESLGLEHKIKDTENYINYYYLKNSLNRQNIFEIEEVKIADKISLIEYYIISVVMIFISFIAISYGYFFENKPNSIEKLIHSYGKSYYTIYIYKNISFGIIISILASILTSIIYLINLTGSIIDFNINIFSMIIISFSMAFFIRLIMQILGNSNTSLAIIFLLAIIVMFICGDFIPSVFLPSYTSDLAKFMPYYYWRKDLINAFKIGNFNIIYSLIIGVLSLLIGSIHYKFLANKWRG